ncbi:unnamed protein product [Urochloa humidicola]
MVDHCVVNWLHNTIAKNVFDIVYKPRASAFTVWADIEGVFRDNELHRAVLIESEFRSIMQGDMTMMQYTSRLKKLADDLRDLGQPVSEPSQVLNLLRGLNPKFRYVKPVVSSRSPPHTFRNACSFLLLEESQQNHDAKADAGVALYTGQGGSSSNTGTSSRSKPKNKKKGKGPSSGSNPPPPPPPAAAASTPAPSHALRLPGRRSASRPMCAPTPRRSPIDQGVVRESVHLCSCI